MRQNHKHMPKCPQTRVADIVVPAIHPEDTQPMERSAQSVTRSTIFMEVCRGGRCTTIHDPKQETDQHHKVDHIDMVNINSVNFNNKSLVITENIKTSSNQVSIIVPYNVDTSSNGNIMPLQIYKKHFPGQQMNNWRQPKMITYNSKCNTEQQ